MHGRQNLRTKGLLNVIRAPHIDRAHRLEPLEQVASRLLGYLALIAGSIALVWMGMRSM